jgi:abequosyltransferase
MEKLLTVAIPTYNRAPLLDRQLGWFAQAVEGKEQLCELIVSDNCSTDETQEVIARWRRHFHPSSLQFHANRNQRNLGPIRNIAYCINRAEGKHVWTVGDDDAIAPHALRFVLESLQRDPDLALLILNFASRHCQTGELKYARCFEVTEDQLQPNGKPIVEWALKDPDPTRWGGLVLTTALVYRTPLAQQAVRAWPEGLDNLYLQFFITTSCAIQGKTLLTKETFLEMAEGRHFFSGDKAMLFRFKMAELPESLARVAELGYCPELCREKAVLQRRKIKWPAVRRQLVQRPLATLRLLMRHRSAMKQIERCRQVSSPRAEGTAPRKVALHRHETPDPNAAVK